MLAVHAWCCPATAMLCSARALRQARAGTAWLSPAARAPVLAAAGSAWALERLQAPLRAAAGAALLPACGLTRLLAAATPSVPALDWLRAAAERAAALADAAVARLQGGGGGSAALLRRAAFKRGVRALAAALVVAALWSAPRAEGDALRCAALGLPESWALLVWRLGFSCSSVYDSALVVS